MHILPDWPLSWRSRKFVAMVILPITSDASSHTGSANEAVALELLRDFKCEAQRTDAQAAGAEREHEQTAEPILSGMSRPTGADGSSVLPGQSPHNEARHVLCHSPHCRAYQALSPQPGRLRGTPPIVFTFMCGYWTFFLREILVSNFDSAKKAINLMI